MAWERAVDAIEAAGRAGIDVPASDVLPTDLEFRPLFDAIMSWSMGVDTTELSTADVIAYDDSEIDWAVPEGLGAVVARAGGGLDVVLDCPVLAIDRSGPRVRMTTRQGNEVEPGALPTPEATPFVASDTTTRTVSITSRPAGQPLLLVLFGRAYARELEQAGALEAVAREELASVFGTDLTRRIRRTTATAWLSDPWARGSYSAARPGCARCRSVLTEPVDERVFFAGEACAPTAWGAIHGAWLSAVEAASRVVDVLVRAPANR